MVDIVIVSGYFNPLHVGHLEYIDAAKGLGNNLIAIVNNDKQVKLKGSVPFMPANERLAIVQALGSVDTAILSIDTTRSVCDTLRQLVDVNGGYSILFATGADHTEENTVAERLVCESLGIEIAYGVGGQKIQSSSNLKAIYEN